MKVKNYLNQAYRIVDEDVFDYLNIVTRSSTKKQREKFNIGDIFINAAVCKNCGDYVRSKNSHNFVKCICGKVGVDGGSWYIRRLGDPNDRIDVVEGFYK